MVTRRAYPSGTILLALGTKRGLFLLTSRDRHTWTVEDTALKGGRVFYAILDQRDGSRLFAADNGDFFGAHVRYSGDFGQSWSEPEQGIRFPPESGRKLSNIWTIEPGRPDDPGTLYAGVDPASLWVTHDFGAHWEMVSGLDAHPTREQWQGGGGGLCLHSIVVDRSHPSRMWVGISAVGCLRTDDGGKSWSFQNKNVRAEFLPERFPEFGQCVHRLLQHSAQPEILYQQNHCGLYRSENGGREWTEITANLPSDFGFPLALDPHHPETLFAVVENFGTHSSEPQGRHNITDQFTVYRSENGGSEWHHLTRGLPKGPGVSLGVYRHGVCTDTIDPCGVYVGTSTGQLFASADRGDSWSLIADFLPPIYSVTTTIIS